MLCYTTLVFVLLFIVIILAIARTCCIWICEVCHIRPWANYGYMRRQLPIYRPTCHDHVAAGVIIYDFDNGVLLVLLLLFSLFSSNFINLINSCLHFNIVVLLYYKKWIKYDFKLTHTTISYWLVLHKLKALNKILRVLL